MVELKLEQEEREGMLDTLAVFGNYPYEVYANFCDARLIEEYERIVGDGK
ncbi:MULTISPECIES: hypothetical protein [Rummeliibacillus]|nr:hypothetical protein [Rummeliibacillus sp. TYF-LIM-RU47]